VGSVVAVLLVLLGATPAAAGPDVSTDVAAIYAHVPFAAGGATGPFTTVYVVSNATSATANVNVKCFNSATARVGPAAGTDIVLGAFSSQSVTPVSLGLTTAVGFDGLGFCYFARTLGINFAVTFAMGIQGNNPPGFTVHPLGASNASLAIGTGNAQADVTQNRATAPVWLGSNWITFLFVVCPTAAGFGPMRVDVFDTAGKLLGSPTAVLSGRGVAVFSLSAFGGQQGTATVNRLENIARGYQGWVYGFNLNSFQAFLYDLPLDRDDVGAPLDVVDRP